MVLYFCTDMDITAYISSGILETYCLGLVSNTERLEVEEYARLYPEIRTEIDTIHKSLEEYAKTAGNEPRASRKTRLLLAVYEQASGIGKTYPPLINENSTVNNFREWMASKTIPSPVNDYDNLAFYDLPSTDTVTNFMIWAREGHEEEEHAEYNEYIVILDGHCDMYFNGEKKHFKAGEIIFIPPLVPHIAVVTSDKPMIAIVQRQLIAA